MLKIRKIDHVAVGVADLDEAAAKWQALLGIAASGREMVPSQRVEACVFPMGESNLELITPRGNEPLARFLEKRGRAALHHICVEVEGLESAIAFLVGQGIRMIDTEPRQGARCRRVAFIHPDATGGVLVELTEAERK